MFKLILNINVKKIKKEKYILFKKGLNKNFLCFYIY